MFCHEKPERMGSGANYKRYEWNRNYYKTIYCEKLNVSIGERVIGLEEFNGWVWGEGRDGEKEEMVRRAGYQRKNLQKY